MISPGSKRNSTTAVTRACFNSSERWMESNLLCSCEFLKTFFYCILPNTIMSKIKMTKCWNLLNVLVMHCIVSARFISQFFHSSPWQRTVPWSYAELGVGGNPAGIASSWSFAELWVSLTCARVLFFLFCRQLKDKCVTLLLSKRLQTDIIWYKGEQNISFRMCCFYGTVLRCFWDALFWPDLV